MNFIDRETLVRPVNNVAAGRCQTREVVIEVEESCSFVCTDVHLVFVADLFSLGSADRSLKPASAATRPQRTDRLVRIIDPSPYFRVKRAIEVSVALILLVALMPLWLVAGLLAFVDVGSPILFWQRRTGLGGQDFQIYKIRTLKPAFETDGTVTAGNSSPLNDGAACLVMMSESRAQRLNARPIARILAAASAGVDPSCMGLGPIPASRKALARAGLRATDMDSIELNEAFASQVIACIRDLELDPARVNPNGGAIALGHPLGASGVRILATLVHELARRKAKYGLATMCIGVGQGIATVVENLAR